MFVSGLFAGKPLKQSGEPLTQAEEMNNLADALYDGDILDFDEDGVVHLDGGTDGVKNGAKVTQDPFSGKLLTQAEEMNELADALYNGDKLVVERDRVVHLDGSTDTVENGSAIPEGTFAASIPSDPDQWYNKNGRRLFRTEVAAMKHFFPKAGFSFMKSTGNMYWVIDMKISQTGFTKTWRFMLVYDKNHPHNNSYGGSIKVYPIRPNEKDIRDMARDYGRKGVPHLLLDADNCTYLCTRRPEDVKDGTSEANSAVSVAGWAADWALHFELGLRNDKVWNKFCDDEHFYSYKTCFQKEPLCRNADPYKDYRCGKCSKR